MTSQTSIDLTALVDSAELYRHAFVLTGVHPSKPENETIVVPLRELSEKFEYAVVCYGVRYHVGSKELVQGIVTEQFRQVDAEPEAVWNLDDYAAEARVRIVGRNTDGSFSDATHVVPAISFPFFSQNAAEALVAVLRGGIAQAEVKPPEKVRYLSQTSILFCD